MKGDRIADNMHGSGPGGVRVFFQIIAGRQILTIGLVRLTLRAVKVRFMSSRLVSHQEYKNLLDLGFRLVESKYAAYSMIQNKVNLSDVWTAYHEVKLL